MSDTLVPVRTYLAVYGGLILLLAATTLLAFIDLGAGNTAVGGYAGEPMSDGSNNTFLGFNTGPTSNGLTNATAIGYSSQVGASNSLVLGGTGSYAVKVGIGTTTPTQALDVNGNTIRVRQSRTPSSSSDSCAQGEIAWDGSYTPRLMQLYRVLGDLDVDAVGVHTSALFFLAKPSISVDVQQRAREAISTLVKTAERLKISLNIENIFFNGYLMTPMEMNAFVDSFSSPAVRVHFDTGNAGLHTSIFVD